MSARVCVILGVLNLLVFGLLNMRKQSVDYQAFFAAGRSPIHGMYSREVQRSEQHLVGDGFYPFIHPPLEKPLFWLFSRISYRASLWAWRLFSIILGLGSCLLLADCLDISMRHILAIAAIFSPVWCCLYVGQDTMLSLAIVSFSFWLFRKERDALAGCVLAFALFKPPIPLLLAFAMTVAGRKVFAASFAAIGTALLSVCAVFVGSPGIRDLLRSAKVAEGEAPVRFMPNIRGVMALAFGDHPSVAALVGVVLIAYFAWRWRNFGRVFATAVPLACLVSTHTFAYDYVLLLIPVATLLAEGRCRPSYLMLLTSAPLFLALAYFGILAIYAVAAVALLRADFRLSARSPVPRHS